MIEKLIKRAEILFGQNRNAEASKLLSDIYSQDPNNVYVLSLYSHVSLNLKQLDKANDLIDLAISLDPDNDHLYYLKSNIFLEEENYKQAEGFLEKAIAINPYFSHYFALLANITLARKEYQKALEIADKALSLDSSDILALNIRSTALLKLKNNEDSFKTIENALEENPNDCYTHTNFAWNLLENGDNKKALYHFREALSLNPNFELAKNGMKEALKANYFVYKKYIQFAFWMNNFTEKYQWVFIIGFYFAYKILAKIASSNETFRPFIYPILAIMFLFAISTWLITPFSNMFFRFNKFGKHLLDKKEKLSSTFVAISFIVFLLGLVLYIFQSKSIWFALAIYGFTMMIPLGVMFTESKIKNVLLIYTCLMAFVGLFSIYLVSITNNLTNVFTTIYFFGFIAFQWIANFIMIKESNI